MLFNTRGAEQNNIIAGFANRGGKAEAVWAWLIIEALTAVI
jgi:hypothetical protein